MAQSAPHAVEIAPKYSASHEIGTQNADKPSAQELSKYIIKDFGIDEVNSAGGVEPYFVFINQFPSKIIKYIQIRVTPYNKVGDVISSEIGGKTTGQIKFTGPLLNTDDEKRAHWGPIWYNHSATCIKVESVKITFVTGKSLSFAGKSLKKALAPELANDCKLKM
jgi:hypothetical protein